MVDASFEELCPLDLWEQQSLFFGSERKGDSRRATWSLPSEPTGAFRHDALGRVFLTDPADGEAVEVVLQGLLGDGLALDGEFVRAGSDRRDGLGVAASVASGDFRFVPDTTEAVLCMTDLGECPAFDAVNVYYHVDQYARHFWEAKMGVDIGFKAEARVHVAGDGGFADWTTRSMKLGVGSIFMKNGALSDDLIYHEYSHLVIASLGFEIGTGVNEQTRALHEAYADYFTATWTDDPRIGEWLVTCPPRAQCQGPANATDLRTLHVNAEEWNWRQGSPLPTLKYGICTRFHEGDGKCKQSWNNFTNPYVWGMIWGAALWDLRTAVGADITDHIILEAVRQHTHLTTFDEAYAIVEQTGYDLYGPDVGELVRSALERRGFGASFTSGVRDNSEVPVEYSALELWPNPATTVIRLRSNAPGLGHPITWSITDMLGRVVLKGQIGTVRDWSLDISTLTPGAYRVRVRKGVTTTTKPFVIIR